MKGVEQIVSSVLLTGILIAVVTAVTAIGLPLLDKTRDASSLENSRNFMINLENSVKDVANNGGRVRIPVMVDSDVSFDPDTQKIEMRMTTSGTIYDSEAQIPLGRNDCGITKGKWQDNSPLTLCVLSTCIEKAESGCRRYTIAYTLEPVELMVGQTIESKKIELQSAGMQLGNQDSFIVLEKLGDTGSDQKKTLVGVSIES